MIRILSASYCVCLLFLSLSCQSQEDPSTEPEGTLIASIAFGSCNKQNAEQILWDDVLSDKVDAWIWLGDNIYGDSYDSIVMKEKYDLQKSNDLYQKLSESTQIFGIWDDHDYGLNDGGKEFTAKKEMRNLLFDFLDLDSKDPAWSREGAYQSHSILAKDLNIKLILLDSRYFRDMPSREGNQYVPNLEGTILGDDQWNWLEEELNNESADLTIVGNGIQILSSEHRFEKWANFPVERSKLFDLISKSKAKKVILLSGDRHISELSKIDLPNLNYPLYDITSSGMTHSYTSYSGEPNRYRQGEVVNSKSYGLLQVSKDLNGTLRYHLVMKGDNGKVYQQFELY